MSQRWAMHLEDRAWDRGKRLFIAAQRQSSPAALAHRSFVLPFSFQTLEEGIFYDTPTISETWEQAADNCGDVTGFLQAALDCAWEAGMRPKAYADNTNELAAVRYHLEDMRALAKVPRR